ncbi:cytochrome c oxidase subunit 7C, mitochondrial-like [Styela clava]
MLTRRFAPIVRRGFSTTIRRNGGHGKPTAQDMLPFDPFQNRYKLLIKMSIYIGTAFSLPFFAVYFQLRKKYGEETQ